MRTGLRDLLAAPGFARLWAIGGCINAMRWFEVLGAALFTFDDPTFRAIGAAGVGVSSSPGRVRSPDTNEPQMMRRRGRSLAPSAAGPLTRTRPSMYPIATVINH